MSIETLSSISARFARSTALAVGVGLFCGLGSTLATSTPALAAGVAPGQATPVQREQAQSRFLRGKEKFSKGDHAGALTEFNASLDIVASPNARLFVGRCLREMGRLVEAYVELGRTEIEAKELAKDDPRYEKAGQSAREERSKLQPRLGFVEVEIAHAEPTTILKVGNDEVRPGGWNEPIPVMPGNAEIVATTQGRAPVQRTIEIKANERKRVSLDTAEGAAIAGSEPTPEPSTTPAAASTPLHSAAYVAGGAAIVGLGLFTVFGIMANGTYSNLEKACPNGPCPPGHAADISEGRTQQTVANIGLAVFVIGAAAGVTLWAVSAPSSKGRAPSRSARATASPTFVGFQGVF